MDESSKGKFVCIYRTPSKSQIALIKSLLNAEEIPYFIENESFASLYGSMDGAINLGVMVSGEFSEKAKELLSEIIEPKDNK